ncbi:membrane-associated phospholipid phosphatase [Nocardioides salarius]|uniref:Membrane-associated phospholipid phosphatase n=1 Tax=Nocardioides salarius TaxID=374513 RepID=A0ABS2M541_9ACTN|nr:phosphatase PAP2 family protein [Nocardioides salarius]MBM7506298.1 membrane-associated phospholipid phosphatase [Nocardioides salarius]
MLRPSTPDLRRDQVLWTLGQALLVTASVYLYFRIRHLTEGSHEVAVAHARDLVALEQRLGIAVEETLQEPFLGSGLLATAANSVYIYGHWPVITLVMLWTVWRHRAVFQRLRDAMIVSGLVGMVVFAAYPLAPPRLAHVGVVDTITRENDAYRVLQPPQLTNQYAALPSLHAGWDLLVGIAVVTAAGTAWLRAVGWLLPVLMTISVVVTGNHYLLDVVAGLALALVGHAAALRLERLRHRRRPATS